MSDLDFLMEIVTIVGWNQIDQDWIRYINLEPEGCFIAEIDSEPVGTATTICYEDKIGWIGMVIVKPSHRGKGIGLKLLHGCIGYLKTRVETIKLDATQMGEPLYLKLGFKPEYTVTRLEVDISAGNGPIDSYQNDSLSPIISFDEKIFGASREHVLEQLFREYPDFVVLKKNDNDLFGYVSANQGQHHWHIGPLVANNEKIATLLLKEILEKLSGKPDRRG